MSDEHGPSETDAVARQGGSPASIALVSLAFVFVVTLCVSR